MYDNVDRSDESRALKTIKDMNCARSDTSGRSLSAGPEFGFRLCTHQPVGSTNGSRCINQERAPSPQGHALAPPFEWQPASKVSSGLDRSSSEPTFLVEALTGRNPDPEQVTKTACYTREEINNLGRDGLLAGARVLLAVAKVEAHLDTARVSERWKRTAAVCAGFAAIRCRCAQLSRANNCSGARLR